MYIMCEYFLCVEYSALNYGRTSDIFQAFGALVGAKFVVLPYCPNDDERIWQTHDEQARMQLKDVVLCNGRAHA